MSTSTKAHRRLHALERLLVVADILRQYGTSVAEAINAELADRLGCKYHPRTTIRDLELLARLGYADVWIPKNGCGATVWRWMRPERLIDHAPVMAKGGVA